MKHSRLTDFALGVAVLLPVGAAAQNTTNIASDFKPAATVTYSCCSLHTNTHIDYNGGNPGVTLLYPVGNHLQLGGMALYNSQKNLTLAVGGDIPLWQPKWKAGRFSVGVNAAIGSGYGPKKGYIDGTQKLDAVNPLIAAVDFNFLPKKSHFGLDVKVVPWTSKTTGVVNFGIVKQLQHDPLKPLWSPFFHRKQAAVAAR